MHSLALQDPLEYFAHQLHARGVPVTTGTNSVDSNAVNYIFGAHLGVDEALARAVDCVFVNLEQLGHGGAHVAPHYLHLLRSYEALDYDADNVSAYRDDTTSVPLLRFGFDRHRAAQMSPVPLGQRSAGLVFIGSLVPRRMALLQRIAATGVRVTVPQGPLYGEPRDRLVADAEAVVNLAAYETTRFEQVRASLVMSLGTPLISERRSAAGEGAGLYEDSVHWFDLDGLEQWFTTVYGSPAFRATATERLARFRARDVGSDAFMAWQVHLSNLASRRGRALMTAAPL